MLQAADFKTHILEFSGFVWHESDVSMIFLSKITCSLYYLTKIIVLTLTTLFLVGKA
jgi:hypothetical protein